MNTAEVIETSLSDQSKVHDVVFVDDVTGAKVRFCCLDEGPAKRLNDCINECSDIQVDEVE